MAVQLRVPSPYPWAVRTFVPNEKETDILGTTQAHYAAGGVFAQTLRTHALRRGLPWLIRSETELRYPRADGSIGIFYPDVLVASGRDLDDQAPYEVRAMDGPPRLVLEIISNKTVRRDLGPKRAAYAEMGVTEYLTFDPRPRKSRELRGYRLARQGAYEEIVPGPEGRLWLATLALWVQAEPPIQVLRGPLLRLATANGERLLHPDEEAAERDLAEQARDLAEQARDAAEQARDAAEEARDAEYQARLAAEAELARLRALLDQSGRGDST